MKTCVYILKCLNIIITIIIIIAVPASKTKLFSKEINIKVNAVERPGNQRKIQVSNLGPE